MTNHPENKAVRCVVNHYLTGINDIQKAKHHIEQAFYSSTNLHTLDEHNNLSFQPRDSLVNMVETGQVPNHTSQILDIDIIDNMAMAKVEIDLGDRHFYDFLTLLKLNVGWKIVSKTYITVMK